MASHHHPGRCSCGGVHSHDDARWLNERGADAVAASVDNAVLTGLFPNATSRRNLIRAVGAAALLDAASAFLPIANMKALAAGEKVTPEKTELTLGLIPITCATPLIMAETLGMFRKQGIEKIHFAKTASPATIRSKLIAGEFDLAQQVMPVPIATTIGTNAAADLTHVLSIQNQHGSSLILALKHKDSRDPKSWKGLRFGVPFEQAQHAIMIRYMLAEHGVDPDNDVSFRVVAPSDFITQMRSGNIDGFFGPEPHGQRAVYEGVGYVHTLSRDLWPGHPCCAFTARAAWMEKNPNTFLAAYRAVIEASVHVSDAKNRTGVAAILSRPEYLDQPEIVLEQVLAGRYADGLGNTIEAKDRIVFDPFPHHSMAIWFMTQLKRWGMIKGTIDYADIAKKVMLSTEAGARLAELGQPVPPQNRVETIMGKPFDPAKPEEYIASFRIRRV